MKNGVSANIFHSPAGAAILALLSATGWGMAYPLIKLGFAAFDIAPDMPGSKLLFAGVRFFVSGLIILAVASFRRMDFSVSRPSAWLYIFVFSLVNTTLHYAFFYFGLSHCTGARASVINSAGVFALVILACVFFRSERMTAVKAAGCLLGICGIAVMNLGSQASGRFTLGGDGMILLNAMCSAAAGLMTRGLGKRVDVFVGTGYSLAAGGAMLVLTGLASGGTLGVPGAEGIAVLLGLICISTVSFSLYNKLLTCNPIGKIAIFNSLIPVVGVLSSCLILHETFYLKYAIAALLAAAGIYVINKDKVK